MQFILSILPTEMSESHKFVQNSVNMSPTSEYQSNSLNKRSYFVDILAVLFGMSSWIGVTSTYLQVPLLVSTAPEGSSLPAYMTVVVQSSNAISFAYVAYQKYSPKKFNDAYAIYFVMSMGCLAAVGMAFLYQHTININGSEHSVAYLIFVFIFATVGTLSSVLFLPFMGRFRECYLVSYMCGQGLNGFLVSGLALIQGVGNETECPTKNSTNSTNEPSPKFSTQIFFFLVFSIIAICTIAFFLLNTLEACKKQFAPGTVIDGNEYYYNNEDKHDIITGYVPENVLNLSTFNFAKIIIAIILIGFFGNGIFPGLQLFSSQPYGFDTYHLVASLVAIGNAAGGFVAQFVPHTSIRILDLMTAIVVAIGAYIFYAAACSPYPPFLDTKFGPGLMVGK